MLSYELVRMRWTTWSPFLLSQGKADKDCNCVKCRTIQKYWLLAMGEHRRSPHPRLWGIREGFAEKRMCKLRPEGWLGIGWVKGFRMGIVSNRRSVCVVVPGTQKAWHKQHRNNPGS